MVGKIFVSYRRDDERAFAARVRDRLAQTFGGSNVFMDVDNLMAGQRFDRELEKALDATDVFLAVMGPRWMELYEQRRTSSERDYVHEEIAGALRSGITVIPVLIEGASLPRADALPEDIRELVLHQKHDVTHDHFGQNLAALVAAIRFARKSGRPTSAMWRARWGLLLWMLAALATAAAAYTGAYYSGAPISWPWPSAVQPDRSATVGATETASTASEESQRLANAEIERERQERIKAEAESKRRLAALAAKAQAELEERRNAEADAKRKADEAEAKRNADEMERLRLVELQKAEAKRQEEAAQKLAAEEAEARRKIEDESRRLTAEAERKRETSGRKPPDVSDLVSAIDNVAFASSLQSELKRVGCYDSNIDGIWGSSSRVAFTSFLENVGLPTGEKPAQKHLDIAKSKLARVCPFKCEKDERLVNGQCVANTVKTTAKSIGASTKEPTSKPAAACNCAATCDNPLIVANSYWAQTLCRNCKAKCAAR